MAFLDFSKLPLSSLKAPGDGNYFRYIYSEASGDADIVSTH